MSINLHAGQSEVYSDLFVERNHRFAVVCCSRGWGKSYKAAVAGCTAISELLTLDIKVPNKTVYIIAPTYDQVRDIYYPLINYDLGMENYALKSSRDLGRFLFPNNVELRLLSYEAVERMRGKGAYFVVWDEVSSCKRGLDPKEAWQSVIQPTILTRWSPQNAERYGAVSPGRALIISTPKGYNFFHELYNYQEIDSNFKSFHYDFTSSPFLDPIEIERIRHTIDPVQFASEYLASFEESGNNVFYCFDRKKHVTADIEELKEGEDVHINIDFNVGLQCSSMFVVRGGQAFFLDEFKGHPDTETLADMLSKKYSGHKIHAYPDPSGRSRKTSAPIGRTDFSILQSRGIKCLAHKAAPAIVDSVNSVNRMLLTAAEDISLYVHPRCTGLINSLERTRWADNNINLATIDKKDGVEHFSDGVRYGIEYLFPIVNRKPTTHRGFNF